MKGFILVVLMALVAPVYAQTIRIEGAVEKQMTLSSDDLQKLPAIENGVSLFKVIQLAGIPSTNTSFTSYVLLTAKDNYKVIFTLSELDPVFTSQEISIDPKTFRVVVPNDKKHARWIKDVISIKLVVVD